MRNLNEMGEAMDFIEYHVINNPAIDQELKLKLIHSQEMVPYAFLGALSHLQTVQDEKNTAQEDTTTHETLQDALGFYD